jgi:hypothetical protein
MTVNTYTIIFVGLLCILIGYFGREALMGSRARLDGEETRLTVAPAALPSAPPVIVNVERGGDDRYTMAPPPERRWGPVLPSLATRGPPDPYQQMGIVTTGDGQVLPLYGRRTQPRSDRFQYYTRTDTYNPVALPVRFKRRDCQDGVGCEEMFDGDKIHLEGTEKEGTVKLYGFGGPF